MLQIAEFEPIVSAGGGMYRPRVYADPNAAVWDGYVVFFPVGVGSVVSTPRETTQSQFESLQTWAMGLDRVYLEGALARALEASVGVAMSAAVDVTEAETSAAADAIALHRAAERAGADAASQRAAAEMHEQAAATARENAERLEREQRAFEDLASETVRTTAETVAEAHESAAREARAVAADATPRTAEKGSRTQGRSTVRKRRR